MADPASSRFGGLFRTSLFWPVAGLGLLLLFNLIVDPAFFALAWRGDELHGPLVTVIRQSAKVMLLATGMTLVIATGGVDLSVGSVMAVCGAWVAVLADDSGAGFPLLLAAALGVALLSGLVNGLLVSRAGIQPIVATLILMVLGRGLALGLTGGLPVRVSDPGVLALGRGFLLGIPAPIWLALGVAGLAGLICRRTALGLFLESAGDNGAAARLAGVPSRTVLVAAYVFASLCAALAALVAVGDVGRVEPDRLGQMLELDAITAVVVGGTVLTGGRFSLAGSLIGALLIQTLTVTLIRLGLSSDVATVPKALVMLAVCLLQSPRLRGRWTARRAVA
jgi:simple sugar transport system permease protein